MFPNPHSYLDPRVETLDKWYALSDIPGVTLFAVSSGADAWETVRTRRRAVDGKITPCVVPSGRSGACSASGVCLCALREDVRCFLGDWA
jgi:hypothetical protein